MTSSSRKPNTTIHPDEAVAKGAALYAAKLMASQGENTLPLEVQERARALPAVQDIVPDSIGISVLNEEESNHKMNSIILRVASHCRRLSLTATPLPTMVRPRSKSMSTKAKKKIWPTSENWATFELTLPEARPAGSPLDVQVGLDLSGIIRVPATDVESGQQQKITIDYRRISASRSP